MLEIVVSFFFVSKFLLTSSLFPRVLEVNWSLDGTSTNHHSWCPAYACARFETPDLGFKPSVAPRTPVQVWKTLAHDAVQSVFMPVRKHTRAREKIARQQCVQCRGLASHAHHSASQPPWHTYIEISYSYYIVITVHENRPCQSRPAYTDFILCHTNTDPLSISTIYLCIYLVWIPRNSFTQLSLKSQSF